MTFFDEVLTIATSNVSQEYFLLPIADSNPVYRERVYCYELYHQMRCLWPTSQAQYILNGEVDKRAHNLIQGRRLSNTKPDFLVHIPGNMAGNHTVMEVKSCNVTPRALVKDLETLTAYREQAEYSNAILLIYGESHPSIVRRTINQAIRLCSHVSMERTKCYLHNSATTSAVLI